MYCSLKVSFADLGKGVDKFSNFHRLNQYLCEISTLNEFNDTISEFQIGMFQDNIIIFCVKLEEFVIMKSECLSLFAIEGEQLINILLNITSHNSLTKQFNNTRGPMVL